MLLESKKSRKVALVPLLMRARFAWCRTPNLLAVSPLGPKAPLSSVQFYSPCREVLSRTVGLYLGLRTLLYTYLFQSLAKKT
eukprot:1375756-Amphidinium_carterae.1